MFLPDLGFSSVLTVVGWLVVHFRAFTSTKVRQTVLLFVGFPFTMIYNSGFGRAVFTLLVGCTWSRVSSVLFKPFRTQRAGNLFLMRGLQYFLFCCKIKIFNLVFSQLESQLVVTHAKLITQLEKEINDYPEHVCCSCEQLHQRKSVTRVNISDNHGSEVWECLNSGISALLVC